MQVRSVTRDERLEEKIVILYSTFDSLLPVVLRHLLHPVILLGIITDMTTDQITKQDGGRRTVRLISRLSGNSLMRPMV